MIDPLSRAGRELKAAEEFFELAKNASSPFMQVYYRRVAERFLSSQGELKPVNGQGDGAGATALKFAPSPALSRMSSALILIPCEPAGAARVGRPPTMQISA
jgi:hypothetical protein